MLSNVGRKQGAGTAGIGQATTTSKKESTRGTDGPDKRSSSPELDNTRRSASPGQRPRVSILGFASDTSLLNVPEGLPKPHPYRATGHVGVSTDGGKTIVGFGPSAPGVPSEQVIASLIARQTFPGKVTDDTHVFKDVHDNPLAVGSSALDPQVVYKKDIPVSREQLAQINATLAEHMGSHELPEIRYGFPFPNTTARNCATYPAELGLPLPHPRGNIAAYVPALKAQGEEWHPPE